MLLPEPTCKVNSLQTMVIKWLLVTPPLIGQRSIAMTVSVCLTVSPSVREHISGTGCSIFVNFHLTSRHYVFKSFRLVGDSAFVVVFVPSSCCALQAYTEGRLLRASNSRSAGCVRDDARSDCVTLRAPLLMPKRTIRTRDDGERRRRRGNGVCRRLILQPCSSELLTNLQI